jgi:hypothetical protein
MMADAGLRGIADSYPVKFRLVFAVASRLCARS